MPHFTTPHKSNHGTIVSIHVWNHHIPIIVPATPGWLLCGIHCHKSLDWFSWENLHRKPMGFYHQIGWNWLGFPVKMFPSSNSMNKPSLKSSPFLLMRCHDVSTISMGVVYGSQRCSHCGFGWLQIGANISNRCWVYGKYIDVNYNYSYNLEDVNYSYNLQTIDK